MRIEIGKAVLLGGALALSFVQGCGDDGGTDAPSDGGADGGIDGGDDRADGGVDGGADDPLPSPVPCDACAADETCVRDACVADCGGDPAVFDAALAEGVAVVAGYCRASDAYGPSTVGGLLDLREEDGFDITLSRVDLSTGNGTPPAAVITLVSSSPVGVGPVFWGSYLAESPDGSRYAFGYTQGFGDPGRLFIAGADLAEVPAPGNFDAAWLDDATLLVDGQGLGDVDAPAQGLDVLLLGETIPPVTRRLLTNAFDFSGSVAVLNDVVVYGAASFDGETGTTVQHMLALSRDDVEDWVADAAAPAIDAQDDPRVATVDGGPSAFIDAGDGRLVSVGFNAEFERVFDLVPFSGTTAESFAVGTPVNVAGPPGDDPATFEEVFTGVVSSGVPGFILFVHADGILLVDVRGV